VQTICNHPLTDQCLLQEAEWWGEGEVYVSVVLVLVRAQKEVTTELTVVSAEKLRVFFRIYNRACMVSYYSVLKSVVIYLRQ
jgi:hypothetical protein